MRHLKPFLPFIFALILPSLVWATDFGGVGGKPAHPDPENALTAQWFVYNLAPGESVDDELLVRNTTNKEVTVKLYPADYVQSTDGGFALEQEVEPRDEVGAWIKLSEELVTLPAMSEATVAFTLAVPDEPSLDVGEHMGGILIQEVDQSDNGLGGLQLLVRTGVRVYVTLPGTVEENIKISHFDVTLDRDTRKGVVATSVTNEGTVSKAVTVKTDIEHVYPIFGRIWKKLPQNNARELQVIRDDELVSHFEFDMPWFAYAIFKSHVEYTDLEGKTQSITTEPIYRWILPPKAWLMSTGLGILSLSIFTLLFIGHWIYRKLRRKKKVVRRVAPKKAKKKS